MCIKKNKNGDILLIMKDFGIKIIENTDIKPYLSFGVGGSVRYLAEVSKPQDIINAILISKTKKIPYRILGGGKNVVCSDKKWNGIIIRIIDGVIKRRDNIVFCDSGVHLSGLVSVASKNGLSGIESLAGIPGTVGGAIYGNAGAYGRSISDFLEKVVIFDGRSVRELRKEECDFSYRHSIFKDKKWVILSAEFKFSDGDPVKLQEIVRETINKRWTKFGKDPKCPGSYFKNVLVSNISKEFLVKIDSSKIIEGKIPAGYLLESVGAKGMRVGGICVSDFHGNIILNDGTGTCSQLLKLSRKLKKLVKEKYNILLEEEVVFLTN